MARAVIVAVIFAATSFGGVYTADMDGAGAGFSVPQLGEQLPPPIVKYQATPWSPPGPATSAIIGIGSEPVPTDAKVLLMVTSSCTVPPLEPEEPQDARTNIAMIATTAQRTRFIATFKTDIPGFDLKPKSVAWKISLLCECTDTARQMLCNFACFPIFVNPGLLVVNSFLRLAISSLLFFHSRELAGHTTAPQADFCAKQK
jgi:hypothetical protein